MAEFFHGNKDGNELSEKIKHILKGKNVRCAVAFWGAGSDGLFENSLTEMGDAKIVCDISMGCTSDKALKKLKAPDNVNLRHFDKLHSKIYISDRGAIVGSANASNNGIGLGLGRQKLYEAGIFLDTKLDEKAFHDIEMTFENYFENSLPVDDAALSLAKKNWEASRPKENSGLASFNGSIIDYLCHNLESFGGTGIVFTKDNNDADIVKKSKTEATLDNYENCEEIENWNSNDMWTDWNSKIIATWPDTFFSFHLNKNNKWNVHFYRKERNTNNAIFGKKIWRSLSTKLELGAMSQDKIAEVDREKLNKTLKLIVRDGGDGNKVFATVLEFRDYLRKS